MRIKALSACQVWAQKANAESISNSGREMCRGCARGLGCWGISCLLFIPTQCLRIHFFPLKIWKCQIVFSLRAFDLTASQSLLSFLLFPTSACAIWLHFISPSSPCRFLMRAGRLWRACPHILHFSLSLFSSFYLFALVQTFFFQKTYLFSHYCK